MEYSADVEKRWRSFKDFFDKNEIVIVNRWINMTVDKRQALLASEWKASASERPGEKDSEMPKGHRPDLM